jgi:hypothetical protein
MIFLALITVIVTLSIKAVNVNTKLVGNMQTQKEAEAAAQQVIEKTISSDFTAMPSAGTWVTDNGQSVLSAYTVVLPAPVCTGIKAIKLSELDATNTDDQPCYASGAAQNTGIVGSGVSGNSLCSNSNWEVNATATPPASDPTPTVHQGIAVRVAVGAAGLPGLLSRESRCRPCRLRSRVAGSRCPRPRRAHLRQPGSQAASGKVTTSKPVHDAGAAPPDQRDRRIGSSDKGNRI